MLVKKIAIHCPVLSAYFTLKKITIRVLALTPHHLKH